ncbi:MAG TPA: DUF1684 domain-containing protein [Luteitalea sp.]|nr:DUF1684 domain-containing protein [Luteitalea sp.]
MRAFVKFAVIPSLAAVSVLSIPVNAAAQTATPAATVAKVDTDTWRQKYEADLRTEYGWLSVAGLEFLPPGVHTIGSLASSDIALPAGHAPLEVGRLVVTARGTTLHLKPGVTALVNGQPAPLKVALHKTRRNGPGQAPTPADRIRVGRVEFHLHESGDRLALRVRDPESPLRVGFQGTRWFAPTEAAHVTATLRRFDAPRNVAVTNILGDTEPYTAPGVLEFTYGGTPLKALAFTASRGRLQLIFRDATVGRQTYGTRFLYAEPRPDGTYDLDFNRAYNPPCAYNPYTTCPTPPAENVFRVAIAAGEKLYHAPVATTASR